jgi:hypothetical protein
VQFMGDLARGSIRSATQYKPHLARSRHHDIVIWTVFHGPWVA